MEVKQAVKSYRRLKGEPEYRQVYHAGSHTRDSHGFYVNIPIDFLPIDQSNGILAFPSDASTASTTAPLVRCRCGFVEKVSYFQLEKLGFMICGVKIMDRCRILEEMDDITNEVNMMQRLQPNGLLVHLSNPHFLRWQHVHDNYNKYIVCEYASNGSLIQYASHFIKNLADESARTLLVQGVKDKETLSRSMCKMVGNTWSARGQEIFFGLLQGLEYMHVTARVAHLDLDPCNIVIDNKDRVKIIDFGSSQALDYNNIVGDGHKNPIKFKPYFVSNEARENNRTEPPRSGFNGVLSDMYSAGVVLYQLICWGYPGGDGAIVKNKNWKIDFFNHHLGKHSPKKKNCYICRFKINMPRYISEVLFALLQENPLHRWTATRVLKHIRNKGVMDNEDITENSSKNENGYTQLQSRQQQTPDHRQPNQIFKKVNVNDNREELNRSYKRRRNFTPVPAETPIIPRCDVIRAVTRRPSEIISEAYISADNVDALFDNDLDNDRLVHNHTEVPIKPNIQHDDSRLYNELEKRTTINNDTIIAIHDDNDSLSCNGGDLPMKYNAQHPRTGVKSGQTAFKS